MKLRFKHQKFQADAAKAVCDVFAGQPRHSSRYRIDPGSGTELFSGTSDRALEAVGYANHPIVPGLTDTIILEQLNKVQRANQIKPSERLEGKYNLSVEMETGVGKTYTYIKTMYELHARYGWSKYIVVVPSIAIREGVYKTFQITAEHFAEEYGRKIHFFIYNSKNLTEVQSFAQNNTINVMIINAQAFNARGQDARRIYMKLDEFQSRRPIDVIAQTNPILIIDEPQSVEGRQTRERLREFRPMLTLRYSATHRADSVYNMVYRLDAQDAYNQRLVKRIAVKGISETGSSSTDGYVYLQGINLSKAAPTATIQFDTSGGAGVRKKTATVTEGFNLFPQSGEMEQYRDGYVVKRIDGRDGSVEFLNGKKLYAGDVLGNVNEEQLRRLQIRETILSHIEREQELYPRGIKVLSLFFIDEVKNYRDYDAEDELGIYARMFEEEYREVLDTIQFELGSEEYREYLSQIKARKTHAGYFSQDRQGHFTNGLTERARQRGQASDDVDAYDLIMKNKEKLLDRDPRKSPVRFIFSHSALREGWDNPNVFQICTLKQSSSEVRKRQEVGRGLRLCVNQLGERMDSNALADEVHNVNVLTVIASESYESFARGLQTELAEAVADRPTVVSDSLFVGKTVKDGEGNPLVIDEAAARKITHSLIVNGYVDENGALTDKYYEDKKGGSVQVAAAVEAYRQDVLAIIASIYDARSMQPENARANNVEAKVDSSKLGMPEFKELWKRINGKSVYVVDFDSHELISKAVDALNRKLNVSRPRFVISQGSMRRIESRESLQEGLAFERSSTDERHVEMHAGQAVRFDLVGRVVEATGLTRGDVAEILGGIEKTVFDQFKINPEEFIIKAANIINEEKATVIIQHITYHTTDERYESNVFTEPTLRGKLGVNAFKTQKNLYDHLLYDSDNERRFAEHLDTSESVAIYVKLPKGFFINTPVGHYNPDWAISFYEGMVKHIYFVAETKGSMSTLQLREIESAKIHCAREHFKAISSDSVHYEVVDSYQHLMDLVSR